jgi:hypothetical protein
MPVKGWRGKYNVQIGRAIKIAKTVVTLAEMRVRRREEEERKRQKVLREQAERHVAEQLKNSRGWEVSTLAEEYAVQLAKLPERIAAIIGKTYAVQQDAATLPDDEAISRINDLLYELDPQLIERNKNKKLMRKR